jgi:eukaryotic-like serine/threonine-protein kinase
MEPTVERLCSALVRHNLLPAETVRVLFQRWTREAGIAGSDLALFGRWLETHKYATAYQIAVLNRDNGDQLFLNEYTLLDRIGRGRMAGVYKAAHRLGQIVAIKVLPPTKAKNPEAFARFQREARMAVRLQHSNIVRTFQTGKARSLHFLVMEYLDGETLGEVLQRRGALPPAEAVRLTHQAMLGLAHIHEQGLVHRDLNPSNLMIVDGQPDSTSLAMVKILDIGMGRTMFDEGDADSGPMDNLTVAGDILGSPSYMAPEQARDAHNADIRADIYALGCVLYHMLTGQEPFPDVNRVRQLVRHATEAPRPLNQFKIAAPPGLQAIVDTLTAKDPAQRYPTPDQAAKALAAFMTTGAEARAMESIPQMQAYLRWLETQGADPEPDPDDPDTTRLEVRELAPPTPQTSAPPRPPLATPLYPNSPLANRAAPHSTKQKEPKGSPLSRRDLTMLAVGIGGFSVVLGFVGWYWFLTRNKKKTDKPPDDSSRP